MRNIKYQEDQIEFSKQPGVNILVFASEKCPACRRAKPRLRQLENKVNEIAYVELTEGINIDKLKVLPTIVLYRQNKKPVLIEGFNEDEIMKYL